MSGFFSFFPSTPNKKKKWVEATSSEHRRADTFHLSPDCWKRNISELKQEGGVVWGGTKVPRGAGGTVLKGTWNKMESCCLLPKEPQFDLRLKKTVLFEGGKFFAVGTFLRGHQPFSASTIKARTSSSCPTASATLVKKIKKQLTAGCLSYLPPSPPSPTSLLVLTSDPH